MLDHVTGKYKFKEPAMVTHGVWLQAEVINKISNAYPTPQELSRWAIGILNVVSASNKETREEIILIHPLFLAWFRLRQSSLS